MATFPLTEFQQYRSSAKTRISEVGPKRNASGCPVMDEASFLKLLRAESKRAERSGIPYLVMLIDTERLKIHSNFSQILDGLIAKLRCSIRETDILGWSRTSEKLAVLFSGVETDMATSTIINKMTRSLRHGINCETLNRVDISYCLSSSNQCGEEFTLPDSKPLSSETVGTFA